MSCASTTFFATSLINLRQHRAGCRQNACQSNGVAHPGAIPDGDIRAHSNETVQQAAQGHLFDQALLTVI